MAVDGVLHLLHDDDPEEEYHTLYMKAAAELAGVRCKVVCGVGHGAPDHLAGTPPPHFDHLVPHPWQLIG